MIFITVGTQKFQFNRLLKYIDQLIDEKAIKSDDVFCQSGFSTYKPKFYEYKDFLSADEFNYYIEKSDLIICHGGVGTLLNCLDRHKTIIAVPRKETFDEHIDDHQSEICNKFYSLKYILVANDYESLKQSIVLSETFKCLYKTSKSKNNLLVAEINAILKEIL